MSLRLKFGVLLCLIGLAVTLTLAASWFAFAKLESEVSEPLRSMAAVLTALGDAKIPTERCRRRFESPPPRSLAPQQTADGETPPRPVLTVTTLERDHQVFLSQVADIRAALNRSDLSEEWRMRTGATSLKNLDSRLRDGVRLGEAYFQVLRTTGDFEESQETTRMVRANAQQAFTDLHDLIERIEDFIARNTQFAGVEISAKMRTALLFVLGWAVLLVILTVWLGIILLRRWILEPVAALRVATARIAAGDFAHRIQLAPNDRPDELHRLSTEVNHMAGMVKSLQDDRVEQERLAALAEMVRRLAHNLRNPLGGIRGLAEITRADLRPLGATTSDLQENQTRIIAAVDRFEKWLNELLGATRPLSIQPEPTEIERWLKGLLEAHRPMAQTRGVELDLSLSGAPTDAVIDARHLEHALSAMISNAIESTSSPQARGTSPKGGTVQLSARAATGESDNPSQWSLSVTDEGLGVPPSLRDNIFRPYFTTKRDGNGIGLAVAQSIVKAHGGRIEVESPWPPREQAFQASPGHAPGPVGARFTIHLPLVRPEMANNGVEAVAKGGPSGALGGQDPCHRR